jgi:hypothetical protein
MKKDTTFAETGTLPYHLNNESTAKNYSDTETTCPQDNLMFALLQYNLIEDNCIAIEDIIIVEQ